MSTNSKGRPGGSSGVADRRTYRAGLTVFRQGDPADAAYLVEKGAVRITQTLEGGEEVHLASLGPGAIIGEMAVIDPGPRMATVTVETDAVLMRLPQAVFDERMKSMDRFMRGVMRLLIDRVRNAHKAHGPGGRPDRVGLVGDDQALQEGVRAIAHHTRDLLQTVDAATMWPGVRDALVDLEKAVGGLQTALSEEEQGEV